MTLSDNQVIAILKVAAEATCNLHPTHKATREQRIAHYLKYADSRIFTRNDSVRETIDAIGYDRIVAAVVHKLYENA